MDSELLNITSCRPLLPPKAILSQLPCPANIQSFVKQKRQEVADIIQRGEGKVLLIVGPCSIHDPSAAIEYAAKLLALSQELGDLLCILMRVYLEKPRTQLGWKGLLYDPDLDGSSDILRGITLGRQLFLTLGEMGVPVATEFLDPFAANYLADLVTWGCIGARTAYSQTHRQLASALPMPVGFKNSTDGNIHTAINGILHASTPHTFLGLSPTGEVSVVTSSGNPCCHLVLRGGKSSPNYDPLSLELAEEALKRADLPSALLVDCSHDNSRRCFEEQSTVFQSVINQLKEGNGAIRGLLLESHLSAGSQPLTHSSRLEYGVSITDPCMDWHNTEQLIRWGYAALRRADWKNSSFTQSQKNMVNL